MRFVATDPLLRVLMCFGAVSTLELTGYLSVAVVFLVLDIGASAGGV